MNTASVFEGISGDSKRIIKRIKQVLEVKSEDPLPISIPEDILKLIDEYVSPAIIYNPHYSQIFKGYHKKSFRFKSMNLNSSDCKDGTRGCSMIIFNQFLSDMELPVTMNVKQISRFII